jgi:5-methylcytosine-specific restriction endonuclease McrA
MEYFIYNTVANKKPKHKLPKMKYYYVKGICEKCGHHKKLTRHHIIPKSENGQDNPDNIMMLCIECHRREHEK